LNLYKDGEAKFGALRMIYEQFSNSFTAEVCTLLLQLGGTSGVDKLMKIGYGF